MVETTFVLEILIGALVLGLAIYFFVITSTQIPLPFGTPDDDAVNSMKALAFAISCSSDEKDDNRVKISWDGPFGVQGVINCPRSACTLGPVAGGCNIQGGDVRRPFGSSNVNCNAPSGGKCTVTNFLLRQNTAKLDLTNPVSWASGIGNVIDPSTWLAAAGVPRYMAYYESFPQEEYAPFKARGANALMWNMIIGGGVNAVTNLIPVFKVSKAGEEVTAEAAEDAVKASETSFKGGITNRFISLVRPLVEKLGGTGTTQALERSAIDAVNGYAPTLLEPVADKVIGEMGEGVISREAAEKLSAEFIEEAAQRTPGEFTGSLGDMAQSILDKIKSGNGYYDDVYKSFKAYAGTTEEKKAMEFLLEGSEEKLTTGLDSLVAKSLSADELATITSRYNAEQLMEDTALQGADGSIAKDASGNVISNLDDLPWGKEVAAGSPISIIMNDLKSNLPKVYESTGLTDLTLKDKLASFYQTLDFKKGVTQWLKDQKMAQYLEMQVAAGLLSDTDILGVPASDVPKFMQCRTLGIKLGRLPLAKELTGDAICAILVANDILVQKSANLNIPIKSVGLNTLGLKAAYGGVYKFQLDDDVNSYYVPLLKKNDLSYSWFSGQSYNGYSPVRLNFASPCSADVTTAKMGDDLQCNFPLSYSKQSLLGTGNTQYFKWYTAGGTSFLTSQVDNYTYNQGPGQALLPDVVGVKECPPVPTGDVTQFMQTVGLGLKDIYGTVTGAELPKWSYPAIGVNYTYNAGFCNTEITGWFAGKTAVAYIGTTAVDITVTTIATAYTGGLGGGLAKAVSGFATGAALAYLQENVINIQWPDQRGGTYTTLTS